MFSTPTKPKFEWTDDIKDLKDGEIEELIIHCRSATASFEAELSDRSQSPTDSTVQNHSALLLSKANNINDSGLSMKQECQLKTMLSSSTDSETNSRNEVIAARRFLWLVATVVGWSYAVLLLYALGKNKIQKLSEHERVALIKYVKENHKSLHCFKLEEIAISENLHQSFIALVVPKRNCQKRKRNDDPVHSENPDARLLKELGNSSEQMCLLLLLSSLGGYDIPKSILVRGCSSRLRWDDTGEVKKITAVDAGLDPDIFAFLSNDAALDRALQALVSCSLLESHTLPDGQSTLTIKPHSLRLVTQQISQRERDKYSIQAWVLACQAFYRGQSLEPL